MNDSHIVRRVPDGPYTLVVELMYDKRLRKSARWTLSQETIRIRVPALMRPEAVERLVDDVIERVLTQRARARTWHDDDLEQRARAINRQYFNDELHWHTIRWVTNMTQRLGSCTEGGTTDGDIRISVRIRNWPDYVVDYIIAHELAHRKYPNHSAAFWDYLGRYPLLERARGFIEGQAYAQGEDADSLI